MSRTLCCSPSPLEKSSPGESIYKVFPAHVKLGVPAQLNPHKDPDDPHKVSEDPDLERYRPETHAHLSFDDRHVKDPKEGAYKLAAFCEHADRLQKATTDLERRYKVLSQGDSLDKDEISRLDLTRRMYMAKIPKQAIELLRTLRKANKYKGAADDPELDSELEVIATDLVRLDHKCQQAARLETGHDPTDDTTCADLRKAFDESGATDPGDGTRDDTNDPVLKFLKQREEEALEKW